MIRLAVLSAFGLGVLLGAPLMAEPIPVAWSFRNPFNEITFPSGATGGLTFPNTEFRSFAADQTILASTLSSYSIAKNTEPDILRGEQYQFALDLRDDASGEIARLQFKGVISGELWREGTRLRNEYLDGGTQTATLGGNSYNVSLVGFQSPTGYGVAGSGSITANVQIAAGIDTPADPDLPPSDPPANTAPEPATLIIAGIGFASAGIAQIRRNRGLKESAINNQAVNATGSLM